jgi:NAD-dependent SIR2 family protein deacetylase
MARDKSKMFGAVMQSEMIDDAVAVAARAIRDADALLIGAGAGMGVDSGLPDFRGTEGFWRAYPAFKQLDLRFEQLASPVWFSRDPSLAWGFYGHRLDLYRKMTPHAGFARLLRWARNKRAGWHVFTSNVDGHFQRAGFDADRVLECHGSLHHLQCARPCNGDIWPADGMNVTVNAQTMRAAEPLPRCESCAEVARPNVLMFSDALWLDGRTAEQYTSYDEWIRELRRSGARLAIVELGAGSGVPTVRAESQRIARLFGAPLIRINPHDDHGPSGTVPIPLPAAAALEAIERAVGLV